MSDTKYQEIKINLSEVIEAFKEIEEVSGPEHDKALDELMKAMEKAIKHYKKVSKKK